MVTREELEKACKSYMDQLVLSPIISGYDKIRVRRNKRTGAYRVTYRVQSVDPALVRVTVRSRKGTNLWVISRTNRLHRDVKFLTILLAPRPDPRGIVTVKSFMSDEKFAELKERMAEMYAKQPRVEAL